MGLILGRVWVGPGRIRNPDRADWCCQPGGPLWTCSTLEGVAAVRPSSLASSVAGCPGPISSAPVLSWRHRHGLQTDRGGKGGGSGLHSRTASAPARSPPASGAGSGPKPQRWAPVPGPERQRAVSARAAAAAPTGGRELKPGGRILAIVRRAPYSPGGRATRANGRSGTGCVSAQSTPTLGVRSDPALADLFRRACSTKRGLVCTNWVMIPTKAMWFGRHLAGFDPNKFRPLTYSYSRAIEGQTPSASCQVDPSPTQAVTYTSRKTARWILWESGPESWRPDPGGAASCSSFLLFVRLWRQIGDVVVRRIACLSSSPDSETRASPTSHSWRCRP